MIQAGKGLFQQSGKNNGFISYPALAILTENSVKPRKSKIKKLIKKSPTVH